MATVQPVSQPRSTGKTIAIVVGVIVAVCILGTLCVFVTLALLGPAVGNVFSSVVTSLPPTP
jgi:hypothetical protein